MQEIVQGLQPAIEEFLGANRREWRLHKKYRHNNGRGNTGAVVLVGQAERAQCRMHTPGLRFRA